MSEYIRKEDALEQFYDSISGVPASSVEHVSEYANKMMRRIQNLKPADVAPVVRCKDCKYNATTHKCLNPDSFFLIPKDDDFCSFGKHREE